MTKLTLTDLGNLENQTTAVNTINTNNTATEEALENTLSRDGTSPNQMEADLDMNSNDILNLPYAVDDTSPITLAQLVESLDGISAGAIIDAPYILAAHDDALVSDRRLTASGGIVVTDGGAKGDFNISHDVLPASTILGNKTTSSATPLPFAVGDLTAKAPVGTDYVLGWDQAASGEIKKFLVSGVAGIGAVTSFNGMNGAVTTSLSGDIFNLGLAASAAANALTIALKDAGGSDPTASSPVVLTYRNATATSGDPSTLTVSAANSLTIPSTATMGFVNSTPAHMLVAGFNDAGTFRLGVMTTSASGTIYPVGATGIASSTAMSTSADSAGVWYTGTAVTDKPFVILGRLTYGASALTTAGTWANAPDHIELMRAGFRLPGDILQVIKGTSVANTTTSGTIPIDDTIPQDTEGGTSGISISITPTSQANWINLQSLLYVGTASVAHAITSLFQNANASAIAASLGFRSTAGTVQAETINVTILANSISAQAFTTRFGASTGNSGINGHNAARYLGGALTSYLVAAEIQG